ncbi:ABC transporter ATP-binding protein [Desulfonatronovibrio hydrogenovorans]|uniref:ABC transporter ATP-binding protein n=1 Tax=Desulfonatronovibrio hydrogenovorans TaxID=53245 RepID=UPI00049220DD|nr:oligopeptide/dipeptide ABC transporter ATP-binding protein [Desulfonatronovibrio hydrogenovorans]
MKPETYLSLDNVSKSYPVREGTWIKTTAWLTAVNKVSLGISRGETLGLVGESGCGKSTLGRIACGLERPSQGRVYLAGQNMDSTVDLLKSKRIQMIFQDPFASLNPRQKIGNIIAEPLTIHKSGSRKAIQDRTLALLQKVGLSPSHMSRYPHEFSGGQRQRIAIARAISLDPDLVVCDEPVSALDVSVQAQILNLLKKLQQDLKLSYLFISHDLSVVRYLCSRIAVMYLGRLVEQAGKDQLYSNPCHPYTRALLAAVPVPDPGIRSKNLMVSSEPPNPLNPPQGCHFHPRCPDRMDICSKQSPGWTTVSSNQSVRCFLYE